MRAAARSERWVDQHDLIWLGRGSLPEPIVLAGEPVEAVAVDHLVRIYRRDVLVAEHVQRRKPDTGDRKQEVRLRQGSRRPRRATDAVTVSRVGLPGYLSFAGTNYRVGNGWPGRSAEVCIVAGSVPLSCDGHILRVHPIRHDRAKEHGSGAEPPTSRATKMIMSRRYRNGIPLFHLRVVVLWLGLRGRR